MQMHVAQNILLGNAGLLALLWPAERVMLGLHVSRGVRHALLQMAEAVVIAPRMCGGVFVDARQHTLSECSLPGFQHPQIHIAVRACGSNHFADFVTDRVLRHPTWGLLVASLDLRNVSLSTAQWKSLVAAFARPGGGRMLRELLVGGEGTSLTRYGLGHVTQLLALLRDLESVSLAGVGLHCQRGVDVFEQLRSCTSLRRLTLQNTMMDQGDANNLCASLCALSTLEVLSLRGNNFAMDRLYSLPQLIARNGGTLRELNIAHCAVVDFYQYASVGLQACRQLRVLNISGNGIVYTGELGCPVSALADGIRGHMPHLRVLDARCNVFGDAGVMIVSSALLQNAEVHWQSDSMAVPLLFDDNYLSPTAPGLLNLLDAQGARVSALSLSNNTLSLGFVSGVLMHMAEWSERARNQLQTIAMSNCFTMPLCASAPRPDIGGLLHLPPRLRSLAVCNASLGPCDARALAAALVAGGGAHLAVLQLSSNALGVQGVEVLCGALAAHSTALETLALNGVGAGTHGCRAALGLFKAIASVCQVDIGNNCALVPELQLGKWMLHFDDGDNNTRRINAMRIRISGNPQTSPVLERLQAAYPQVFDDAACWF